MADERDSAFFDRADAHIHLANDQSGNVKRGQVSASLLYGAARFNAFVSACKAESAEHLQSSKEMIIEYFMKEYRLMLEENLNDYVKNFEKYI